VSEPLWPTRDKTNELSDDDLLREHDYWIGEGHQNPTRADFYLAQLRHREFSRRERWMLRLTIAVAVMTFAIVVLTAVNIYVVYGA